MKNTILSLEFRNIRNVKNGSIEFDRKKDIVKGIFCQNRSDVLGIYGQNGSGKTTVVDVFELLNDFCTGGGLQSKNDLVSRYEYLVNAEEEEGLVDFSFLIWFENNPYKIDYSFLLGKKTNKTLLLGEKFFVYKQSNSKRNVFNKQIFKYVLDLENNSINKDLYKKSFALEEEANLIATKINCYKYGTSFIFSDMFIDFFKYAKRSKRMLGQLIQTLKQQVSDKMFVIRSNRDYLSTTGSDRVSFLSLNNDSKKHSAGLFRIFDKSFEIPSSSYGLYEKFVEEVNGFISSVVEDFELMVIDEHETKNSNGKETKLISIARKVGNGFIPISAESCGIRKLINLTYSLISIYGDENGWLIVDELDSGIFEDLLGNIVNVIENNAKGLLLFTAHNLSPLERIEPKNIVFATTNPLNRYIRFSNIKKSNNLRKLYLRSLVLGGQEEEMAYNSSSDEINAALFNCYSLLEDIDMEG